MTSAATGDRPVVRLRSFIDAVARQDVDTTRLATVDAIALAAVTVLAALTASSLVLADVHSQTLAGSLGLLAVSMVVLGIAARTRVGGTFPGWVRDRVSTWIVGVSGALAAALTVPGFPYGAVDSDPGGYVAEGVQIAHSGSYSFTDPVLVAAAAGKVNAHLVGPGAVFSGIWIRDEHTGLIVPQFYHAHASLLAVGWETAGEIGLRLVTPLEALVAVIVLVAIARRIGGRLTAALTGVLIATNMLQVWQAREPSSEVLAEAMWLGAMYGVIVAVQTRWRVAAFTGGLCVGGVWLDRADGVIAVCMLAALGALLIATRRWDGRAWWGLAGFAVVAPLAFWQAYYGAITYTKVNGIPPKAKFAALLLALLVAGAVVRVLFPKLSEWAVRAAGDARWQQWLGALLTAAVLVLVVVGFLRSHLFGVDYGRASLGVYGRTYNEVNLRRLSWFFSLPGIALACLGIAVIAFRRWSAALWTFVLPSLVLSVLYLTISKNSPQLMFWGRRYVPNVVPFLCFAIALVLAGLWRTRAVWGRVVTAVGSVGLVGFFLFESLPVRGHEEWSGSFAVTARVAHLSGGHGDTGGVFLVGGFPCCEYADKVLGAALWLERDQLAVALVPSSYVIARGDTLARISRNVFGEAGHEADLEAWNPELAAEIPGLGSQTPLQPLAGTKIALRGIRAPFIEQYFRTFSPGRKVFVITPGEARPEDTDVPGLTLTRVDRIDVTSTLWRQQIQPRPHSAVPVPIDASVWRVDAVPGG